MTRSREDAVSKASQSRSHENRVEGGKKAAETRGHESLAKAGAKGGAHSHGSGRQKDRG
ncbi:MAG: hypothetical protein K0S08_305 [Gammaproteobacteria bacterium]|jgi:hypothetical protein|nr:hypothetical protein [Gammaproteobacteria bacterium]